MRAYVVGQPGGAFEERDIARPIPEAGQVLVRVAASGVNPLDTKIRAGKAGHAEQPLPAVLGLDVAGVVEEVGAGVTAFRPGDEVYGMVGGVGRHQGTLAESVAADASLLALKPKTLSMREAAVMPLVTITAWEGIVDRANVHEGQRVLVHAGAGGVWHVAVQLAKARGAEVFATVSAEKKSIVEGFGGDGDRLQGDGSGGVCGEAHGRRGLRRGVRHGGRGDDRCFICLGEAVYGACGELPGVEHALTGSAVVSWGDVFRCVYADAPVDGIWACASRGDSARGCGAGGCREATAVDE